VDQSASQTVGDAPAGTANVSPDGLAERVAAVEAARERLGQDLEQLNTEVRAQVSETVERTVWKIAAAGAAVAAGLLVRKLLDTAWRKTRKTEPPDDPSSLSTGLGEALAWTAATAVGAAVARVVAQRGAAAGWEKATGSPPPAKRHA
jgi:hypothetical protein